MGFIWQEATFETIMTKKEKNTFTEVYFPLPHVFNVHLSTLSMLFFSQWKAIFHAIDAKHILCKKIYFPKYFLPDRE